mgnify:CR=1 FL=1
MKNRAHVLLRLYYKYNIMYNVMTTTRVEPKQFILRNITTLHFTNPSCVVAVFYGETERSVMQHCEQINKLNTDHQDGANVKQIRMVHVFEFDEYILFAMWISRFFFVFQSSQGPYPIQWGLFRAALLIQDHVTRKGTYWTLTR